MGIQYLPYQQIDQQKWDACIDTADSGLIYARYFYLDTMAKHWDALVLNDYEAVMPLTWNKKMGIAYLYMPPFTQQLGIFGKAGIIEDVKATFLRTAGQHFKFAELFVNFNCGDEQPDFILPLHLPYELINQGYKTGLQKSLKQAGRFSLTYLGGVDIAAAVGMYKSHYSGRFPHIKQQDYLQFIKVCEAAKTTGNILIRTVVDENHTVMAIALLLKDKKRLYNIISTVTPAGRQCSANHYLYDNLIKEFAGRDLLLDFEGSSIPGIAAFYQSFGAVNEPYYFLRYNHLAWPFKYLKKWPHRCQGV